MVGWFFKALLNTSFPEYRFLGKSLETEHTPLLSVNPVGLIHSEEY